jgi:hypothetical protein
MSRTILTAALATAAFAFAARPAAADGSTATMPSVTAAPAERTVSINVDPFGAIQGYYGGNVEWLHGSNGVVVDADYWHSANDVASAGGAGGHVGYRWHWRGRQNSGFLGLMVGGGYGTGTGTVTNNAGQSMTYDMTINTLEVTADIGKRWQLDNGLNITFRIGGGYAQRTASTTSTDPDVQQATKDFQDVLAFLPIAFDGELSLGYSF